MSGGRHRILFTVFVAVAGAAIVWLLFGESGEQRLAGKPIGFWLDEMIAGGARSNAAVTVFVQAGEQAAGSLTNELRFVPPSRNRLIALKAQLPWAMASRMPSARPINWTRRVAAANALGRIGPNAKIAIPALLNAVTATEPIELSLTGFWAGMTLYPESKCTAARAIDILDMYGMDQIWMNSACDWGISVPLAVPRAALEMRKRGYTEGQIDRMIYRNPIQFMSQSPKFKIKAS